MENLKAQGKIRFMGFSFHDSLQLFKRVVEYTPAWDFCLIQHNYLDYEYEAGVLGPKYAAANGMGLAVMKTEYAHTCRTRGIGSSHLRLPPCTGTH